MAILHFQEKPKLAKVLTIILTFILIIAYSQEHESSPKKDSLGTIVNLISSTTTKKV